LFSLLKKKTFNQEVLVDLIEKTKQMMQGLIVELFFLIDGIDKLYNTLQRGIK
jgi:hypothetical protein